MDSFDVNNPEHFRRLWVMEHNRKNVGLTILFISLAIFLVGVFTAIIMYYLVHHSPKKIVEKDDKDYNDDKDDKDDDTTKSIDRTVKEVIAQLEGKDVVKTDDTKTTSNLKDDIHHLKTAIYSVKQNLTNKYVSKKDFQRIDRALEILHTGLTEALKDAQLSNKTQTNVKDLKLLEQLLTQLKSKPPGDGVIAVDTTSTDNTSKINNEDKK